MPHQPRKFHCLVCQKDRTTLGERCPTCKSWVGIEDWIESPEPKISVGKSRTEQRKSDPKPEIADFNQAETQTNTITSVDAA